ncbi:MAG: hypothetical protein WD734_01630 [Dehalococcoidia bacterium]
MRRAVIASVVMSLLWLSTAATASAQTGRASMCDNDFVLDTRACEAAHHGPLIGFAGGLAALAALAASGLLAGGGGAGSERSGGTRRSRAASGGDGAVPPPRLDAPEAGAEEAAPRGPAPPDDARIRQRVGADGQGRVRDRHGNVIALVENGRTVDMDRNPVTVYQGGDPDGPARGVLYPDGRHVTYNEHGVPLLEERIQTPVQASRDVLDERGRVILHQGETIRTVDTFEPRGVAEGAPRPGAARATTGTHTAQVEAIQRTLGAGPEGELYGADGAVIGRVDDDLRTTDMNHRPITPHEVEGGRVITWTDAAGRVHGAGNEVIDPARAQSVAPAGADGEPGIPRTVSERSSAAILERLGGGTPGDPSLTPYALRAGAAEGAAAADARGPAPGTPGDGTRVTAEDGDGTRATVEGGDGTRVTAEDGDGTRATAEGGDGTRVTAEDGDGTRVTVEGGDDTRVTAEGGDGTRVTTEPGDAARVTAPTADDTGVTRVTVADDTPARPEAEVSQTGTAVQRALDFRNAQQLAEQHVRDGKSPEEAWALAIAQTGAGNYAQGMQPFGGVTDPRLGFAGGMLMGNSAAGAVMPDKVVENFIGTGYDAVRATYDAFTGDPDASGATALDEFGAQVLERENPDFMTGFARLSELAGEEAARTDGGNVLSDMQQIYETGAYEDVADEALDSFRERVAAGREGVALEGLNHLAEAAAETYHDPEATVGQFAEDTQRIWEQGIGADGWQEIADHNQRVASGVPFLSTVAEGYGQIGAGLGEAGVGGFASEMGEGAAALADEAYQAAGEAAEGALRSVYDYLHGGT